MSGHAWTIATSGAAQDGTRVERCARCGMLRWLRPRGRGRIDEGRAVATRGEEDGTVIMLTQERVPGACEPRHGR